MRTTRKQRQQARAAWKEAVIADAKAKGLTKEQSCAINKARRIAGRAEKKRLKKLAKQMINA
jgi:hypothetical protein